ncbi:hypothetical protein GGTG_03722 [Gaeumannomyces tritici R3-111a-1]|uniref:Uncharacterized protein n=1 Tax=Gaeumannomyces tritici (strain R3-111a-1) TaxID=644352 RepID=J3NR17_GAET3|nr:hypothetical protein GGTG_03722 [Gaeumannomyces tritici R3-111a-1]EJT78623.1 hypothetical protein GGTG_03722 [Gaeumannomyces tritici R3-111a-1]
MAMYHRVPTVVTGRRGRLAHEVLIITNRADRGGGLESSLGRGEGDDDDGLGLGWLELNEPCGLQWCSELWALCLVSYQIIARVVAVWQASCSLNRSLRRHASTACEPG